jgi:hypothetical protein
MLRFQTNPGIVFSKIFENALTIAIDEVQLDIDDGDEDLNFARAYFEEEIIKAFGEGIQGVKLINNELKKLLKAHLEKDVLYMPSDWHFKILDRVLRVYCDCYTESVEEYLEDPKYASLVVRYKDKPITELNAGDLMDCFFWDSDYDFDPVTAMSMKSSEIGKAIADRNDVSIAAINASLCLPVDSSDLKLEKYHTEKDWLSEDGDAFFDPPDPDELE